MRRVEQPSLPATVVTGHLAACAEALATAGLPVADLAAAADDLVAGQRHLGVALDALAARLTRGPLSSERAAAVAVLRAAAEASRHAADALSAGEQLFEKVANETAF